MENTEKSFNKYLIWLPLVVLGVVDVITMIIYPVVSKNVKPMIYVQITASFCAIAAVTLVSKFTSFKIPVYLIAEVALSAALANNFGTLLDVYHSISCWDLILHAYFGFWCAQAVWLVLKSDNLALKYLLVFVCVMGVAALWEVFEFTTDILFDGDAQRVKESMELGINPIIDTMTDIIIAIAGYAAFVIMRVVLYFARRPRAAE